MKPSEVNWDRVAGYLEKARLPDWDKEAVIQGVEAVTDRYLEYDTTDGWAVRCAERTGDAPFPYRIDIDLQNASGIRKIVDWKTKKIGKFDERWELRETRSPQRKIYAGALAEIYGADVFPVDYEVRGVLIDGNKPQHRVVSTTITAGEAAIAVRHLKNLTQIRDDFAIHHPVPWIQDPSGCRLFGEMYKCQFEDACWEGMRFIPTNLEALQKPLSHSSAKEFLRCPERYRALKSSEQDVEREPDDPTMAGVVFHECMEIIYRQAIQGDKE